MSKTEMIIAFNNQTTGKSIITLTDFYSIVQEIPSQVTSEALTIISQNITDTGLIISFSRSLNVTGSRATSLYVNFTHYLSFAYQTQFKPNFDQHNNVGSGIVVMGIDNDTSSFIPDVSQSFSFHDHGVQLTVAWVGIVQLGIFVIRYFKWWKYASVAHFLFGTTALVMTLYSAYKAYKANLSSVSSYVGSSNNELRYHSRIAFTLSVLCMTQFFIGLYTKYMLFYRTKVRINMLIRRLHQIVGWSMPILALTNLKYGWDLYGGSTPMNIIYIAYGILVFLIVILELRHRWGTRINYLLVKWRTHKLDNFKGALSKSVSQGAGSFLIESDGKRHIEILTEIRGNNRQWVFYDEHILDVSGFRFNHPGGTVLFENIYGQDAGKFINGSSSVNDQISPYTHSEIAKNMINFLKIGKLAYPTGVLNNLIPNEKYSSMTWTLTNNTKVSSNVHCLEFASESWEASEIPPGYEWMGKHYLVSLNVSGKRVSRYYSLVCVNIKVWADEVRAAGKKAENYPIERVPGRLRIYVKRYEGGKLSPHVCGLRIDDQMHFKGPLGPGLCVQTLIEEDYLMMGAGTGILPFLDFCYAMWKRETVHPRVYCYISFRSKEESFAVDLLRALQEKHPKNFFYYEKIGNSQPQMNRKILQEWVPVDKLHKVWICGPPGFNKDYHDMLVDMNVSNSKILLL